MGYACTKIIAKRLKQYNKFNEKLTVDIRI